MHYELYVDSLFFINFIMNLYLLILVNHSAFHMACTRRILLGAAVGAVCFLFPFLGRGFVAVKLVLGIFAGTAGMLYITFPIKGIRMFLKLLEKLALYSFGMGGAVLFLIRCLPGARKFLTGTMGIMGVGGIAFLLFRRTKQSFGEKNNLCRAELTREGRSLAVTALVDSGNSLTEPVSGKPVCVVDRKVFRELWKEEPEFFRAIPYHSIGKKKGILQGYLLPGLLLEANGMKMQFRDVYVAVSDEEILGAGKADAESANMIINPGLLSKERAGAAAMRQNERHNDTESDDTGQNPV